MISQLQAASLIISSASTLIISLVSLYGYVKVKSEVLLYQGLAFMLIFLGLLSEFFIRYLGFYFEAVGFLIIGLEHIVEEKEILPALVFIPYVAGATIAIFFSLYAGVETLIFYQKSRRITNIIVGAGLIMVSISIFFQMLGSLLTISFIVQTVGYLIMLSSLAR